MFEILDEKTNMRVMTMPNNPNLHLISIKCISKIAIETIEEENDILLKLNVQPNCTDKELVKIIKLFSQKVNLLY